MGACFLEIETVGVSAGKFCCRWPTVGENAASGMSNLQRSALVFCARGKLRNQLKANRIWI